MEAQITLEYSDEQTAQAVACAVSPDNFKTPNGLSVNTTRRDREVVTRIICKRGMPTFIATIDDLLFCISTAEKALQTTKRL